MAKPIRLDKYLSEMNIGTRSEIKTYVKRGLVTVNGVTARASDLKVVPGEDEVIYAGEIVGFESYVYYMLHKPGGVVTATEDARQETVLDLITDKKRKDLFPVGRLDKDTEGLLLITNDGVLGHDLLSPKKHVAKVYYARIDGCVTEEDVENFRKGVKIAEDFTALPAKLKVLNVDTAAGTSEIEVEIYEGKFHQVKRMFQAVGKEVTYLKRLSMGPLKLDSMLSVGAYRLLTEEEIQMLKGCR